MFADPQLQHFSHRSDLPSPIVVVVVFLGPYLQHMEVPRPGAELELQLPTYTTATATLDP